MAQIPSGGVARLRATGGQTAPPARFDLRLAQAKADSVRALAPAHFETGNILFTENKSSDTILACSRLGDGMRLLSALIVVMSLTVSPALAQGFGTFNTEELSPPGGVQRIVDPTGTAPTRKVDSFSIPSGYCNPKPYAPSGPDSDCYYNSTRAQKSQSIHRQPAEAWYGWWMYLPKDFPYGKKQVLGHYEFAYWHNGQCPHVTFANFAGQSGDLVLQTNRRVGNYDCAPDAKIPVAHMSDIVGRWTRFEAFVRWGDAASGHLTVFLDGKAVLDRDMATLTTGMEKENYFKYGLYLCCTKDVAKIKPMQALFAGVKSAKTREGLAP